MCLWNKFGQHARQCLCAAIWGRHRGEVGLLKFQNLGFSLGTIPTRAFKTSEARMLREHVFPSPARRAAYEITPDQVSMRVHWRHSGLWWSRISVCKTVTVRVHVQILDASDGSTELKSDLDHDELRQRERGKAAQM